MFRILRKTMFVGTVAGAAVGGPYLVSHWPQLKASVLGKPAAGQTAGDAALQPWSASSSLAAAGTLPLDPRTGAAPNADQPTIVDMSEAFRFDVTPPSIMARWPRVSANPQQENLHGLRVAYISGTREDDIAGSLTYYFTPQEHCAKITFSGVTGDPGRLINLMISRFSFKPYSKGEPGVLRYEIRWNGNTLSELVIHPAAVVRSSAPLSRYEVHLTITDSTAR